jgi:hypothetical protein
VVNLYSFSLSCAKSVVATGKMKVKYPSWGRGVLGSSVEWIRVCVVVCGERKGRKKIERRKRGKRKKGKEEKLYGQDKINFTYSLISLYVMHIPIQL